MICKQDQQMEEPMQGMLQEVQQCHHALVNACTHMCVCVCVCVCTRVRAHVHACACMHMCMHAHMHMNACMQWKLLMQRTGTTP